MALSNNLHLYLRLERLMMDLDDQGDPLADNVRNLMDPLWYALCSEEREFLNSRGKVEVRILYPVTLIVPDLFCTYSEEDLPRADVFSADGIGKRFALEEGILCPA